MLDRGTAHEISELTLAVWEVPVRQWMSVRRALGKEVKSDGLTVRIPGPIKDRSRRHIRLVPQGSRVDHAVWIGGIGDLRDELLPGRVARVELPTEASGLVIPGRALEVRGLSGHRGESRPSFGESPLHREVRSVRNHPI
jgi:hypothetical protein